MKLKVNTILKLYSALVILMFGIYASEEAEIPSLDEATTPFYEVGYSAQNTTIPNINGDDNSVADISFTENSEILKYNMYISTKKTFNNEFDILEELKKRTFVVESKSLKNDSNWISVSEIFQKTDNSKY